MNKWNLINADSGEKTWLTPKYIIDALTERQAMGRLFQVSHNPRNNKTGGSLR